MLEVDAGSDDGWFVRTRCGVSTGQVRGAGVNVDGSPTESLRLPLMDKGPKAKGQQGVSVSRSSTLSESKRESPWYPIVMNTRKSSNSKRGQHFGDAKRAVVPGRDRLPTKDVDLTIQ